MKIGILTFIHTKNYGANLQCFALQYKLNKMGYDTEVLNLYRPIDKGYLQCASDENRFSILYTYKSWKDYKSRFNKTFVRFLHKLGLFAEKGEGILKDDGFTKFQHNYIKFSNKCYRNYTELYEQFPHELYSHLIVGSDQVWNYASRFPKEPFFLTFTEIPKKISYAASLGHTSIPSKIKPILANWLSSFSAISVREESAVAAISEITNLPVKTNIDPIFLLDKKQWMEALTISENSEDKYVLVYMLSVSEPTIMLAQKVAEKLHCGIKIITSRPLVNKPSGCEVLKSEDPRSFVEHYTRASFVVTNSFHGTAFSIDFNIPFVTMDKPGGRLNSRKGDLLKLLHLENRNLFEGQDYVLEDILSCDFLDANIEIERQRTYSMEYLNNELSELK